MPRPASPLISHEAVVRASIEIIDEVGLEAFSLPRLADYLSVRAPSLYHHFADKNDILTAVATFIARGATTRPRQTPGDEWAEYFVTWAINFRTAVMKHRNAAMVMVRHMPRDVLTGDYEDAATFLRDSGVPAHLHVQILDGLQAIVVGAILIEAGRPAKSRPAKLFPSVSREAQPVLTAALDSNELNHRQLYEENIRSFLAGVTRRAVSPTG